MKPKILLQLDSDPHASSFDAVVAIDAGVDQLLQYDSITPENVTGLVHGAMFTRGPQDLCNTAIFIGGSDVPTGEKIAKQIAQTFFGPVRVSVMLDGNGSNTTAAAAVLCAARHLPFQDMQALVLGGTGPVGSRAARLILSQGGRVNLSSRQNSKAAKARDALVELADDYAERISICDTSLDSALETANVVFGCGAAGIQLLTEEQLSASSSLRVAIDLNAVPPAGLSGIQATDKSVQRGDRIDYGAIGVGGLKMKIHRECISRLFDSNDHFLDADQVLEVGLKLEQARQA